MSQQLEISIISQENILMHPVFFKWFFLKTKTFQAQFCKIQTLLHGYSARENFPFSCTAY